MVREHIARAMDHDPIFTWRGQSVTRIENLSDIVFAIALGMLVSASSPPTDFAGLNAHLLTIVPVAVCFVILLSIWNTHFVFFRRYGVADGRIIFLNALLLLLVLFIAYPLRFSFDGLFSWVLGLTTGDWTRISELGLDFAAASQILAYFMYGFAGVNLIFSSMYAHALSRADVLNLSAAERVLTKRSVWAAGAAVVVAITAGTVSLVTGAEPVLGIYIGPMAGFLHIAMWPIGWIIGSVLRVPGDDEAADLA